MYIEERQLKEFIIDSGLISRADLDVAEVESKKAGTRLGKYLVTTGKMTEDDLRRMEAYILGIPFVDLKNTKIPFDVLS